MENITFPGGAVILSQAACTSGLCGFVYAEWSPKVRLKYSLRYSSRSCTRAAGKSDLDLNSLASLIYIL